MATKVSATELTSPPAPFSHSASAFRIALPQNASLNVQVHPRKARQLPTVQFLGPDHATRGLQATFAECVAFSITIVTPVLFPATAYGAALTYCLCTRTDTLPGGLQKCRYQKT